MSHLRVDNFDRYMWYCLANLVGNSTYFYMFFIFEYLIFGSFENIVTRTFENIIWLQLQVHVKKLIKKHMFLALDIISMK